MLKKVIYPLYVPEGGYCYQGLQDNCEDDDTICPHLVMDGGFPSCIKDFEPEREEGTAKVLKDPECYELEDMKE